MSKYEGKGWKNKMLKEGSTNWAEGWKNKTWKEVFKYEGARKGWKNKMLKELGRVGKNAGGGLEKMWEEG